MESERLRNLANIVGEDSLDVSSTRVTEGVDLAHAAGTPELEKALVEAQDT